MLLHVPWLFSRYAATKGRIVQWTRDDSTGALSNYVGLDFGVGSPGHPLLCDLHAKDGSVLPTGNDQFVSLAISPKDGNFLYALVTANGLTGEMRAQATNCPTMAQRNADGEITKWVESIHTRCTSHYAGSSQLYLLDRNTTSGAVSNFRTAEGRCPSHGEWVNQEISCRRITWGHPKDLINGRRKLYVSCNTGRKNFEADANDAKWHALHMWEVDESGGLSYGKSVATGNIDNINFDFLTSKTEPRRVFMNGQEVPAACYNCVSASRFVRARNFCSLVFVFSWCFHSNFRIALLMKMMVGYIAIGTTAAMFNQVFQTTYMGMDCLSQEA